jgi:hypothetical protein
MPPAPDSFSFFLSCTLTLTLLYTSTITHTHTLSLSLSHALFLPLQNLAGMQGNLKFYRVDLELLFSTAPFDVLSAKAFAFVQPQQIIPVRNELSPNLFVLLLLLLSSVKKSQSS